MTGVQPLYILLFGHNQVTHAKSMKNAVPYSQQVLYSCTWVFPLSAANFKAIQSPCCDIQHHIALGPAREIIVFVWVVVFG